MLVIGLTGGVGAGKSEVLKLIKGMCRCTVVVADELARSLEVKGEVCYEPLVKLLGEDVLDPAGEIDPKKMASKIFADGAEDILKSVNAIVHPAVKTRILDMIRGEAYIDQVDLFVIEAALLIEDGYEEIVDELWYVYADENVRRKRLRNSRGYSDEKISDIMGSQSSDKTFRKHCKVVIDNGGSIEDTKKQLEAVLSNIL